MHLTFDRLIVLLSVLITLGGLLWIAITMLMAWAMLCPPRMSAGKAIYHLKRLSPGDLGLPFEEENFSVRDARTHQPLHIAGWWIPASTTSQQCVLLIHGYADAKVGSIAWAPMLHELNFNILAIDLRAHGDSGGRFTTGGYFGRDDMNQVIDQILSARPDETRRMILFGISLGAAIAVGVASQRSDITAIVLESPFADYDRAIAAHARLLGLPGGLTLSAATATAKLLSGARFEKVRPVDLLGQVKCPVLCIAGCEDELLDESDREHLRQAIEQIENSVYWAVENCGHLQGMTVNQIEYERMLREFLINFTRPVLR